LATPFQEGTETHPQTTSDEGTEGSTQTIQKEAHDPATQAGFVVLYVYTNELR